MNTNSSMNANQYIENLNNLLACLEQEKIKNCIDIPSHFDNDIKNIKVLADKLRSPEFPVAFLGNSGTGKSTIINAIIGREILPENTASSTAVPTLIKKGKKDEAFIYFLGEREKEELWNLYFNEIKKYLEGQRKEVSEYLALSNKHDLLKKLKDEDACKDNRVLNEMERLLNRWDSLNGQVESIEIDKLQDFSEGHKDVSVIDRVEVYLTDIDIPEDVVLVDLPGLGVVNSRHKKITRSYLEEKAKAIAISTAPVNMLEGDEDKEIKRIVNQHKDILQRAFFIVNRWDELGDDNKRKTDAEKDLKRKVLNFGVKDEDIGGKVFKTSALDYLLLKLIADGKSFDKKRVQERFGKIPSQKEALQRMSDIPMYSAFVSFKENLFQYLDTSAKTDFFDEVYRECSSFSRNVKEMISPYIIKDGQNDDRETFIALRSTEEVDNYIKIISEIIQKRIKDVRIKDIPNLSFWSEDRCKQMEDKISNDIEKLDFDDIKNEIYKGMDVRKVWQRLPSVVEKKIKFQDVFRNQILQLVNEKIINSFLHSFIDSLLSKEQKYISENISLKLRDIKKGQQLVDRFKGLCDVLLSSYDELLDEIGSEIEEKISKNKYNLVKTNTEDSEEIRKALEIYKEGLFSFLQKKEGGIESYTEISIKNYFEELEGDLLHIFKKEKSSILRLVRKIVSENIDANIDNEYNKQKTLKNVYQYADSLFNQKNQHVQYQFNAAGNINFKGVEDQSGIITELQKLRNDLKEAVQQGVLNKEILTLVESSLEKAGEQSDPETTSIQQYLKQAIALLENVKSAAELVKILSDALQAVSKVFQ